MPVLRPTTRPSEFIAARAGTVEDQVPPGALEDKVARLPMHTVAGPVMVPASGTGVTVTRRLAANEPQPLVVVYDTMAVPAASPVAMPATSMATIEGAVEDHVPPSVVSENNIEAPRHIMLLPSSVPVSGSGFMVMVCVANEDPQELVTV